MSKLKKEEEIKQCTGDHNIAFVIKSSKVVVEEEEKEVKSRTNGNIS